MEKKLGEKRDFQTSNVLEELQILVNHFWYFELFYHFQKGFRAHKSLPQFISETTVLKK